MTHKCEQIFQKLNIYQRNSSKYTKCLIRGNEIPIIMCGEEIVRQGLLYFLIKQSGLFPNLINIKVEDHNRDVAVYETIKNPDFQPLQPPIMIVEVKRKSENLLNHESQILRYLNESRSNMGVLFNCHQIITYIKENTDFTRNDLRYLTDIPPLILQGCNKLENDILQFEKAQNGSFDSFTHLVSNYGKYTNHTITFKLKSKQVPIVGCCFIFQDNKVYYDIYGIYSRKQQQFFDIQDFERLVSIIY